jgi:DNA polymerase-1
MSAFGLAKQLDISRALAQDYIDSYFSRYPKVLDYMEQTKEQASKLGYVETVFGRRLYLPEINAKQVMRRQAAERTAINAPMQGTAADIIKKAMLEVDGWLGRTNVDCRMIMQVHDELVFECPKDEIHDVSKLIKKEMEQANLPLVPLNIPILVDFGEADNWSEAH